MGFQLKQLPRASLDAAIAKAEHYRDLNQPEEAESICRDILDVDGAHPTAWKILGLALTDRFATGQVGLFEQAIEAFEKLPDAYDRTYHLGVAWERSAKAHAERNEAHSAVVAFEHALELFEKAERMKPQSPDPILRWNRCVRLLRDDPSLRAAIGAPREDEVHLGD
ncbi:MAG TPA: tetratricopeptide repeat protein [Polyangiaceae bacterium]|jgi:tetratricopeptide (TPR) repeat protein|nr:tetratricopeptide repeat protein [Polyangiaceae bacterium]